MGRRRATPVSCPRCDGPVAADARFCPSCGAGITDEVQIDLTDGRGFASVDGSTVVFERPTRSRRTLVVGVLVAGVAAAIAASVAGGGADPQTAPATSTTVDRATTSTEATTSTTEGATTTTEPTVRSIGVGPMLGEPTGLEVYVMAGSVLTLIDLDAATRTEFRDAPPFERFAAVPGGLVGTVSDTLWARGPGRLQARIDGRVGEVIGSGPPGSVLLTRFTDTGQELVRVSALDGSFERVTDVPSAGFGPFGSTRSVGVDDRGALVFDAPGGVFRREPGQPAMALAPGTLRDVHGGFALVLNCYPDVDDCVASIVDVQTGYTTVARRQVDPPTFSGRVSPDGAWIIEQAVTNDVFGPLTAKEVDGSATVVLVDRNTDGDTLACPIVFCADRLAWSPDGRWVFTIRSSHQLVAWRAGLAEPIVIDVPDYLGSAVTVAVPER